LLSIYVFFVRSLYDVPLLRNLVKMKGFLDALTLNMKVKVFSPGDELLQQGDPIHQCYFILQVSATRKAATAFLASAFYSLLSLVLLSSLHSGIGVG